LKRFPVILNTVPVKFKGTFIIDFITGVPVIINGLPLRFNGRNLKELHSETYVMEITGIPTIQLQ
jgi:hypothetical protein